MLHWTLTYNLIGLSLLILSYGIAFGWLFPTLIGAVNNRVKIHKLSKATGVFISAYFLGQFCTPFLAKIFFPHFLFLTAGGFSLLFSITAILFL